MIVALLCGGGVYGAEPPRVGGCPVLPAFTGSATAASAASLRAFNQDVSRSPVDPRSPAYINRIESLGGNQVVHPDFGGNGAYGIPYTTVGPKQSRVRVKVTGYPGESDFGLAPIPADAPTENGSDRHVLVLQRGRCQLFELFAAGRRVLLAFDGNRPGDAAACEYAARLVPGSWHRLRPPGRAKDWNNALRKGGAGMLAGWLARHPLLVGVETSQTRFTDAETEVHRVQVAVPPPRST